MFRGCLVLSCGILAASTTACRSTNTDAAGPRKVDTAQVAPPPQLVVPGIDPERCEVAGKEVKSYDANQDKNADMWRLYVVERQKNSNVTVLTCQQADLDHDGRKDYVAIYDSSGSIQAEEYDFDFDGKFDARIHYDLKSKRKVLVERSTGFTGKTDIWEQYDRHERLVTLQRDRNGDGKPDYWEQYREGRLAVMLYDQDYDGLVDRRERRKTPD